MTPKQELVLELIARVAKKDKSFIQPAQDLIADLGFDSPKQLELLTEMEDRLQIEIGEDDAARINTVGDVLDYVEKKT